MYLVDTNLHAAFLLQDYEDDELTKQYLKLYEGIVLADRVVPDFILGEFETFIMQVVPSRYRLSRDIYFENANTHYMSFVGSLVLATAEQNKYTLFTKDERMKTIALKLEIQLYEPK